MYNIYNQKIATDSFDDIIATALGKYKYRKDPLSHTDIMSSVCRYKFTNNIAFGVCTYWTSSLSFVLSNNYLKFNAQLTFSPYERKEKRKSFVSRCTSTSVTRLHVH